MAMEGPRRRAPYLNEQLQRGVAASRRNYQWADKPSILKNDRPAEADPDRNFNMLMEGSEISEAERTRQDESYGRKNRS